MEHLCQLIIDLLRPGVRWNNGVGKIIESVRTMIEVAGATHALILAQGHRGSSKGTRARAGYATAAAPYVRWGGGPLRY